MLSIDVIYGPLIEFYLLETSNIVYFTLESIYHPPLEMRNTPNLKYRAATDIPLKNEVGLFFFLVSNCVYIILKPHMIIIIKIQNFFLLCKFYSQCIYFYLKKPF